MPIFYIFKQGWVSHGYVSTAYKRVSAITRDVTSYLNRDSMWDLSCRSVYINQLEVPVEGEVNSVCQFHFVFLLVQLNLSHSFSFIVLL